MNAERLLANYEKIADAPDAIARLRRFILDLAVRGKLVPQNASNEPTISIDRSLPDDLERPFDIPRTWQWARLHTLGKLKGGGTPSKAREEFWDGNIPWVSPKDMKIDYIAEAQMSITEAAIAGSAANLIDAGSVLFVVRGMILAHSFPVAIALAPLAINQDMKALVLKQPEMSEYVLRALKGVKPEMLKRVQRSSHGTCRLEGSDYRDFLIPLPPLAEQHRIVAKVDELMALCDRLEAARAGREGVRDRLAAASLARLNAPDPETFQADARFALDALSALTTRPEQTEALRQTIINLAVCGRLVPQDPNEEPALSWLLRIFSGKDDGLGKKVKSVAGKASEEVKADYTLPNTWLWMELGNLVKFMDAGWSPQCENHPRNDLEKWGVLKTTAVQMLAFDCGQHKELPAKFAPRPQHEARIGDILVTRAGPKNRVGISCVVDQTEPRLMISDKLIRFRLIDGLNPKFSALTLNAGVTRTAIEDAKSGMAVMQMNISQDKLRAVPVPLPPLDEQHRIVAQVDALMALCDRLEASLTNRAATRRSLLDALLVEALAPAGKRELEAAE